MMKMLLMLAALVAGAFSIDRREAFQVAYAKFARFDGLLKSEPPHVAAKRYRSFNQFADVVDQVNHDASLPYEAENNYLSILLPEERLQHMGLNVSGHENSGSPPMMQSSGNVKVAESRDFSGKITGIKNQGSCGSCWTFDATAALEGEMYFKNSKKGMSLSEQEYMECSTSRDGCQGGWMSDCYTYSKNYDRIAPTRAAPYKGKDSRSCNYKGKANALVDTGLKVVGNIDIRGDSKLLEYASSHIVSVAIKVNNNFMVYKSGVYVDKTCNVQPNHAVAVVGYGKLKGHMYWKVRNSWGTGWGDKGYVLMDRQKSNMCMISTYAHIPDVQCRSGNCKKADPNDDSDGSDEGGDDGDDEEEKKLCLTKVGLGVCSKTEKDARKTCQAKDMSDEDCLIVKVKKCYYGPSGKSVAGKNFVEIMLPCEEKDDKGGCDAAAGLVLCKDCNCCKHEHMCYDH